MALKFEIIGNNLVVTDTTDRSVKLERPAADIYAICEADKWKLVTRTDRSDVLLTYNYSGLVDSANTGFSKDTFTNFCRHSLGALKQGGFTFIDPEAVPVLSQAQIDAGGVGAVVKLDAGSNITALLDGNGDANKAISTIFTNDLAQQSRSSYSLYFSYLFGGNSPYTDFTVSEDYPSIIGTGTNFYIDPISGNDNNNGTSPATPYKTLAKINGSSLGGAGATVHLAADGEFLSAQTFAQYKSAPTYPAGNRSSTSGTLSNPIVFKPYYPRGMSSSKPLIKWYADIQSSDWVADGVLPNVWHLEFPVGSYRGTPVVNFLLGTQEDLAIAYKQQDVYAPNLLNANGQYASNSSRVTLYCTSNPTSFYGVVKLIGGGNYNAGYSVMHAFNGMNYVSLIGLRFHGCKPLGLTATGSAPTPGLEIAYCEFVKCPEIEAGNNTPTAGSNELVVSFHHNKIYKSPSKQLHIGPSSKAENLVSYEVYNNAVYEGNISMAEGGALFYVNAPGGTRHHVYRNYGYKCLNGTGEFSTDGAFIYADIGSSNCVFFGNIAEQCGMPYQMNCAIGKNFLVGNLAIDCGALLNLTNAAPQTTAPNYVAIGNTWLWTGRISFDDIQAGPDIGGVGQRNWRKREVINTYNQQRNVSGNTTYNYGNLVLLNNLAVNCSGVALPDKPFLSITAAHSNSLVVGGNGSVGLSASKLAIDSVTLAAMTMLPRWMAIVGAVEESSYWMPNGKDGIAIPSNEIAMRGEALTLQYQDINGRNYKKRPSIGCYEVAN